MSGKKKGAAAAAAAVAAGTKLVQKIMDKAPSGWSAADGKSDPDRWRGVTVYRPLEELGGELPEPLARLGDASEVRLERAPGDRGTEIYARLTGDASGKLQEQDKDQDKDKDPLDALRLALREAKQLLEVGYVLEPDRNTTSQPTALNAPLRKATADARGEGRL
jgi:hypothetical protein